MVHPEAAGTKSDTERDFLCIRRKTHGSAGRAGGKAAVCIGINLLCGSIQPVILAAVFIRMEQPPEHKGSNAGIGIDKAVLLRRSSAKRLYRDKCVHIKLMLALPRGAKTSFFHSVRLSCTKRLFTFGV